MPPEYPCTVDEFENSLRSLKPALVFLTGWMMFAAPPKAVDLIVAGVCGVHSRAAVVAGLPLPIADDHYTRFVDGTIHSEHRIVRASPFSQSPDQDGRCARIACMHTQSMREE